MFQPPVFREDRQDVMKELIVAHPFATIVASATGGLTADHVPLVLKSGSEKASLQGHIAANNPLFRETEDAFDVLVIFQGPQTYVTPSWYASKQDHGKVVPTWNYVVVHVRGELRFTREPAWLLRHLDDLTRQHESHRAEPWAVSDAPPDFVQRQLRGLVGFEVSIQDMQGTWKVSQNKSLKDWTGVRAGLEQESVPDAMEIAQLVEERARR
ncbi:MAG: FMN-binding negative transcriptional regulator [Pseudomonadota bacterium]